MGPSLRNTIYHAGCFDIVKWAFVSCDLKGKMEDSRLSKSK